ncbi:MAG: phenylacetate-CoA oxygenase/reductase subunit PaaK [Acidimicrobiia bacterium]|nr:phenylacetate-CoA oxygenase/reductase subunit PaaK [Acidimicrobiia bacterium]
MEFHTLTVSDVEKLTDDSVAVTLEVPDDLTEVFAYEAGQHITLRTVIDGHDVRRSYSICSGARSGELRVGVRRLDGGVFSTWATTALHPGMTLDAMEPVGEFILPAATGPRHVAAIAAGSGITPILSILGTVLAGEPDSRCTLVFGNRTASSIMFLEELEGLKDRYTDRFHMVHILSREPNANPMFSGRIDRGKLNGLFDSLIDPLAVDEWYLCGPYDVLLTAQTVLSDRGVRPDRVHDELFFAGPLDASSLPPEPASPGGFATVTFTLDGRASVVKVDPAGPSILDHALGVRGELPFSCKGGACATCKARLIQGHIRMDKNWALVPQEIEAGLILTCQSHPTTDTVVLDYDV